MPKKRNNFGKVSLVLGIISIVLGTANSFQIYTDILFLFAILSGILGLTLSSIQIKRNSNKFARAGFITSFIGVLLTFFGGVLLFFYP